MTLREAAQHTSRSITTLRRYIRAGRLQAEKRQGRFGPEYFVAERDLARAGLAVEPEESARALVRAAPAETAHVDRIPTVAAVVPLSLYESLQMKHEQLLVQYGMVRASGLRSMELRAELEAQRREIEEGRVAAEGLRQRLAEHARSLREAELECEGRGLEIAALREKVRGLEMLTRNAVTNESIEQQFREVIEQSRRVESLRAAGRSRAATTPDWNAEREPDAEH
jgi:hypothetical protein